jgi:hypothetical protein
VQTQLTVLTQSSGPETYTVKSGATASREKCGAQLFHSLLTSILKWYRSDSVILGRKEELHGE